MPNITLNTLRLYVKNSSCEIPDAPKSFLEQGKPENHIEMRLNHNDMDEENHHEVTLALIITTKVGDKVVCTMKAEQAGIFKIENANEEQLDQIINMHCPHVLYPYACNAISQLSTLASLPAIVLQPVDFSVVYQQKKKMEKEQKEQNSYNQILH